MRLRLGQIADWIHAEGVFDSEQMVEGYSIDTRTLAVNELFFAVKGERLDGHDYVESALRNGAAAAVVSMRWLVPDDLDEDRLLRVPDGEDCVLQALQRLASAVRRCWGGRVIGVTGSAGKTTTKEAIAQVLGARFCVLKSAGNLNNGFGVPLQLLRLEREHSVAVIEMGMNHAGEIAALAKIAAPDWGVVSNVAPVHLEFFEDGIEGIARAKYELVEALPEDGIAVLNFDDSYVRDFGRGFQGKAVTYGMGEGADVRGAEIEDLGEDGTSFTVTVQQARARVKLKLLGRHNVLNALAAIAVGVSSGIALDECADTLAGLSAGDKRGELLEWQGIKIINDCYNSNPAALNSMVDALLAMPARRYVVIAGEMLELGPESGALHEACGRRMAERGVHVVAGVRGMAAELVRGAEEAGSEAIYIQNARTAGEWMRTHLRADDAVLLKASRGVKLEEALQVLMTSKSEEATTESLNAS